MSDIKLTTPRTDGLYHEANQEQTAHPDLEQDDHELVQIQDNADRAKHFIGDRVETPASRSSSSASYHSALDLSTVDSDPKSWAAKDRGWVQRESYAGLTTLERLQYTLGNWGNQIASLWHALGQILSFRGEGSKEVIEENKAILDKKIKRDKSGNTFSPVLTIKKLLDAKGPREGRLGQSDIGFLAETVGSSERTHIVDGNSMQVSGPGFTQVNQRKPSKIIAEALNKNPGKTILMPFSFPAKGMGEAHIVLIAADPKTKEIRYFDPKGMHSDDPARIGGFTDDPNFNMRADLKELEHKLGFDWEIKENTKAYQRDVTNCGTYVALAMRDEAQGRPIGEGWQSGPAWVNAQKPGLVNDMIDAYQKREQQSSQKGTFRPIHDDVAEEDYEFPE